MQRRNQVTSSAGFTLVEAVVTGVIATIVGGAMIAIINLFYMQVNEGTLRAKMQMDYDVVSRQIGSLARISQYALRPGETMDPNVPFPSSVTTRVVRMRLPSDKDTICYRIGDNNVLQDSTQAGWNDFKVGTNTVTLTSNSDFSITADRKTLKLNLHIIYTHKNLHDTLEVQGDPYLCRN